MSTKSINLKLSGDIEDKESRKICNNLEVLDDIPESKDIKIRVDEPTHLYRLCEDKGLAMFTLKEKKKVYLKYNDMWLYTFDEYRLK